LTDKDIHERPQRLHRIKKGMMVSDNIELDFGMARPVLVSGNQGLQAKGVGKSFNKRRVVRNVSLGLQRGEAVGLLGPNGAGKTTTFYMLAGLLPADEGQVFIDGRDVTGMPIFQRARLGMGYLPQESSIFRGLTVEQNIRAVLETLEDHDDERDATLDDLMAEFGITHLRNTPSVSLSGGERRRLEIARALAARPTLLLLDEPLAGIDPIALGEIRDLIAHLKTHGIGVLITDHNVRETLGIVDRAYIIHDGTVLMEGTPDEVVQHNGVRQVYLGERFSI
jgi:lipopolysaccharide export system ATP-binding protein